jgi:enediyne biosynthesis protein E2
MPPILGTLRRILLTPKLADVTFAVRGFPTEGSTATEHLEAIPESVICGFEWGIEHRTLWEVERRLDTVTPELRGFAYEGATMAYTVRDAMAAGRGNRTRELLSGPGAPHIFLTYIGIGFAMARLPRVLWKNVLPADVDSPFHPTMSWLAVDGYGFDRAYFHTKKWVDRQFVPAAYPWAGAPGYFHRALDQGIGRALWFINGALPDQVARAVDLFPTARRADLWSGVGLAAAFAGGADRMTLRRLVVAAGEYRPEVALGTVFAVKARQFAGHLPDHTRLAADALAGLSVDAAVALADRTAVRPDDEGPGGTPAYELWRDRIRAEFRATAKAA